MNPFKVRLFQLCLLAVTIGSIPAASGAEPSQLALNLVYERSLPSIVSITVRDHNDQLHRGSGFFVNEKGLFITTFSVVENAHRITVRTQDGWLHPVDEVIALSKESNLALLRAPISRTRPLEVIAADAPPPAGETAIAIAGAEGLRWHIDSGEVIAPPETAEDTGAYLHFKAEIKPGNQGGPLVNRYGRVMGVLTESVDNAQSRRAIPASSIHALLDKINVLPLSATWTHQPPPPPPPPVTISKKEPDTEEPEETETSQAESEDAAEYDTSQPVADTEVETSTAEEKSQAQADTDTRPPEPPAPSAVPRPGKNVAQHMGQVKTIAWAAVPSQPDPARVCPPMISQRLDAELKLVTVGDRSRADGHLSLGGRLDTGKECNIWGCFDGYRLFMHFVISNSQGRSLYREYFEVDEDDVNEACEELAEDIVDELEDLLDY